jgi:hypothetical protein
VTGDSRPWRTTDAGNGHQRDRYVTDHTLADPRRPRQAETGYPPGVYMPEIDRIIRNLYR